MTDISGLYFGKALEVYETIYKNGPMFATQIMEHSSISFYALKDILDNGIEAGLLSKKDGYKAKTASYTMTPKGYRVFLGMRAVMTEIYGEMYVEPPSFEEWVRDRGEGTAVPEYKRRSGRRRGSAHGPRPLMFYRFRGPART
jgi:predicted transcriptional regulator